MNVTHLKSNHRENEWMFLIHEYVAASTAAGLIIYNHSSPS